jgi:hypothetical protein
VLGQQVRKAISIIPEVISFALNNTHPIDFALKRCCFSGHGLQGFV